MRSATLAIIAAGAGSASAHGPLSIRWYTIDGGGGSSTVGTLRLRGTIGQPDASAANAMTAGTLRLTGGFWAAADAPACRVDVNGDTGADVLDFLDFIDAFGACDGQPAPCTGGSGVSADFNGDTSVDVLDFLDFIDAFGTGC